MKLKFKLIITFSAILFVFSTAILLLVNAKMQSFYLSHIEQNTRESALMGLTSLDNKYPGAWRVEGLNLYKGETLINNNFEIVDQITENTAQYASVFMKDTRVSTNITDSQGNRLLRVKTSPEVAEKVIGKGEPFMTEAVVSGKPVIAYYVPLKDEAGKTVGIWALAEDKSSVQREIQSSLTEIGMIQCGIFLLVMAGIYFIGVQLTRPLKSVTAHLSTISEGKFDTQIPDTRLKDETGDIIRATKAMQNSVKGIIRKVLSESENIETVLSSSVENMDNLKRNMEEASSTTEQLSAGMQETAASMQEMNATSSEIEASIEDMAKKACLGSEAAEKIKERAAVLKKRASESKRSAMELLGQSQDDLKEAINKSKAIEQIQKLTQAILQITSQTNLLSLNAAIEASRAGEAGRGFAVVADEIRKLAEDSKKTVSEIQQVTGTVVGAVDHLVRSSENVMGFIDQRVIKDYESQVETGEQYDQDAQYMGSVMSDFSTTTERLLASISNLMKVIHEVSIAAGEGAEGSSSMAEMAVHVTDKSNEVLVMAKSAEESVEALRQYVGRFTV